MRERDFEKKMQGKKYADENRRPNPVAAGDYVLVAKPRENKLSANFHSEPMKVVYRRGNAVTVEDSQGRRTTRDVDKTKKYVFRESDSVTVENTELEPPEASQPVQTQRDQPELQSGSPNVAATPATEPQVDPAKPVDPVKLVKSVKPVKPIVPDVPNPNPRPKRESRLPTHLQDYVVSKPKLR